MTFHGANVLVTLRVSEAARIAFPSRIAATPMAEAASSVVAEHLLEQIMPLGVLGFSETTLTAYAVLLHALLLAWMVGLGLWGPSQSGASAGEWLRAAPPDNEP